MTTLQRSENLKSVQPKFPCSNSHVSTTNHLQQKLFRTRLLKPRSLTSQFCLRMLSVNIRLFLLLACKSPCQKTRPLLKFVLAQLESHHVYNRLVSQHHLVWTTKNRKMVADLTTADGQALCWSWMVSPSCMGSFCAPPCGTCSRARGIPIKLPNGIGPVA